MARESQQTRVERLLKQIKSADKVYGLWSDRFHVQRLENYYEGYQWSGVSEELAQKKYVINLFFAETETTKPSLLFNRPKIKVLPKPGREDAIGGETIERAQLCEDTVQTFVDDPDVGFAGECGLALHDAFCRFGVVEVGYSADWVDNPNADKPVLKDDGSNEPLMDEGGAEVKQPPKVLADGTREQLFVKWIPAENFRVSISDKPRLETNDWVGYSEWHYLSDVKANKEYKNTRDLRATGLIAKDVRTAEDEPDNIERHHGMVKLWKIWDLRQRVKHVVAEGYNTAFLVEGKPYKFLPFACVKFLERTKDGGHFYPIPYTWNWLSPQDEKNEIREQQKVHRRRFNRRYLLRKGTITPEELTKLESGEDGVYGEHEGAPNEMPLMPVPDAPLDASVWREAALTDQDFTQVAGSPGESRGVAQTTTATQATLMAGREQLRETSARQKVADWTAQIARLILMTVRENMALEFWVKRNVDMTSPSAPMDAMRVADLWQRIQAEDLGDIDLDVSVELASMSPVTEDAQRAQWNQVLALIANPGIAMQLAASPVLLRKTLRLYGVTAEPEIQEIAKACGALVQQQAMAALTGGAGGGSGEMPGVTATGGLPQPMMGAPAGPAGPM